MSFVSVLMSVVGQVATGTPLWKLSVPCSIHRQASQVELPREMLFSNPNHLIMLENAILEEDDLKLLSKVISVILDVDRIWNARKPFNSILGEFDYADTIIDGKRFSIRSEQISHHPPELYYKISGPSFSFCSVTPLTAPSLKPGMNCVYATFDATYEMRFTNSEKVLKFKTVPVKISPLLSSKQELFMCGEVFAEVDGIVAFKGKVDQKAGTLKGDFVDFTGRILDSVNGNFKNGGISLIKRGDKIMSKIIQEKITVISNEKLLNDPLYTKHVWKRVYENMEIDDMHQADVEKAALEESQRQLAKSNLKEGIEFSPRFVFI